ncbi:tRNA A37 threonylcarbamoyladenosine dehydratase [Alteribacillus persepolensis]|uniref:tRNA A37 threonylcarbamoyladenosine dehydratase n=1 Tax=Alteribacillus persepolensis TaxID=568899 RepID=A0A1G8DJH7_9BACI|nr:tRNA threonylcarbamoyladenosine dehydratase [Alteribacillus persepolensis]SDH57629.1 tRNA A37 threonylcarbamoyladenosine dehydratase [Alteribacillus persepolensis]
MLHQFSRNELAVGQEGLDRLKHQSVAVLGVGGVGSFSAEALVRSGIGRVILVDKDDIDITNVNRQLHALTSTVGRPKAEVMKERLLEVNPDCDIEEVKMFYTEETYEEFFAYKPDYIIDASDTISYKIHLITECHKRSIPIISSMGAANKLDPTRLKVVDLFDTTNDPLARVMRRELRKNGVTEGVDVVFSDETPIKIKEEVRSQIVPDEAEESNIRKSKMPPSSNAYVPSVAGLIAAGYVINKMLESIPIERIRQ